MGTEIERKFLLKSDAWRSQSVGKLYRQGYVFQSTDVTVRIRIAETQGYITLKGKAEQYVRPEFEYEIPLEEATELLDIMAVLATSSAARIVSFTCSLLVTLHTWGAMEILLLLLLL